MQEFWGALKSGRKVMIISRGNIPEQVDAFSPNFHKYAVLTFCMLSYIHSKLTYLFLSLSPFFIDIFSRGNLLDFYRGDPMKGVGDELVKSGVTNEGV